MIDASTSRIAKAKKSFMRMTSILTSNHISIHTRRRALECYIESILVYGCEAWTISKQNKRNWRQQKYSSYPESFESHGLQRNINETVLQEADTTRSHIILSKRQAIIFGYMLRKEKLEHLLISGMIEGKCSTGKQRKKMLDRITKWLKIGRVTESLKGWGIEMCWKSWSPTPKSMTPDCLISSTRSFF